MSPQMLDLARNQMDAASNLAAAYSNGAGKLAAVVSEFFEQALENQSVWLRDLATVKSVPEFVQVQTEYAKANYAALIGQAKKNGLILSEMVEVAVKSTSRQATPPAPIKREKFAA